jgi:hypothetical protein
MKRRLHLEQLESRLVPSLLPQPAHVVLVIEENHGFSEIIGSPAAPYINSLAQQGALMTNSFALTHPSQPNYLDLFSGSNQGVTDDSVPHTFSTPNLASELLAAGYSFGAYSESLPFVGFTGGTSPNGLYARKHDPWVNFTNVPASEQMPFDGYFPADFSQLPTVSIVVPNLLNDMHSGSIQQGDAWLQSHLDGYVQWARANNSLLIVTWDEDDSTGSNRIATIFVGPMVTPGQYGGPINHFNVLRTLEDIYNLPYAGASAYAAPIATIWRPLNEKFVHSLYEDFLGREGSQAEWDGWVAVLPLLGRAGVVNELAHSPEAMTRVVDSFYTTFLGRAADPAGEQSWVGFLQRGGTEEQMTVGFLSSAEFANYANGLIGGPDGDANFVQALYGLLLHRGAGSAEIQHWQSLIPTLGRGGIVAGFVQSAEFRVDAVRSFYGDPSLQPLPFQPFYPDLLRRPAAPLSAELAFWVFSPMDVLSMEVNIAASAEYFDDAQTR